MNDSEWIRKDKQRRAFLRWQLRNLDEGGFTEELYFCAKCQFRHAKGVQRFKPHRKWGITSREWHEQQEA